MLDNLKTQMRVKLIQKLKKQSNMDLQKNKVGDDQSTRLTRRLASSLIDQYLSDKQMNFTHQIFLPESGFNGKILAPREVHEVLKLEY